MTAPTGVLRLKSPAEWRCWLEANGTRTPEAWLAIAKKKSAVVTPTYEEAVEEALCFGWIDSQIRSIDADLVAHRFSPRKPGSNWSESNLIRMERLMSQGRVTDAGVAAFANRR